ncbi:MAG: Gfo/Idh/MocA family oxidoreductase [Planctomycetes bacterium]|nr:Gfo/Idh/MocA family oxidoreductase [Planctomycetota bacterium]
MDVAPLKIAIAGAGHLGGACLDALRRVAGFAVVGVGDVHGDAAAGAAASARAPAFTDIRQMLQQVRPDVLLITTPPAAAAELIPLAAQVGCHVIKAAPLARTLDEAVQMVERVEGAGRRFAVLAPRRWYATYRGLLERRGEVGPLFLARAERVLSWGGRLGWRADRASAGGGVLLEAGCEMIDLIVAAMGLPEEVYAVTGRRGRPHMVEREGEVEHQGIYDTDDTAVVVMRYAGGAAGVVTVSWVTSPAGEHLALHGQLGSAVATAVECRFCDADGKLAARLEGDDRPVDAIVPQLADVAARFAAGADPAESSAREHLLTMAVVEAAYLSDRTGQSENPAALLKARDIRPAACKPVPADAEG